jgi:signal transduction histidine kinase
MRVRYFGMLLLVAVGVVPVMGAGLWIVRRAESTALNKVRTGNLGVSGEAALHIASVVETQITLLQTLGAPLAHSVHESPEQLTRILKNYKIMFPNLRTLDIVGLDADCTELATSRLEVGMLQRRCAESTVEVARTTGVYRGNIALSNDFAPVMTVGVRLEVAGEPRGVVVADVDMVGIWETVKVIRVGKWGYARLVTSDGILIAHGDPEERRRVFLREHDPFVDTIRAAPPALGARYTDSQGREVIALSTDVPGVGWTLVVEQPIAEAFRDVRRMRSELWLIVVGAAVFAILLGFWIGREPVQSLEEMRREAIAVAKGNLDARIVRMPRLTEMTQLAIAMNAMAEELVERVRLRTAELAIANRKLEDNLAELQRTQRELLDASRRAGMADVATSVIHNLGNVLNSASVAASIATQLAERSKLDRLVRVTEMLGRHEADLGSFLTTDPAGRKLPEYLDKLAEALVAEKAALLDELRSMQVHLDRIETIVSMQHMHVKAGGFVELVVLTDVVEEALAVNPGPDEPHRATVVRQLEALPPLRVDRHKLLEILVNLLTNARQAVGEVALDDRRIIVRSRSIDATSLAIDVEDNGAGIAPQNIDKIFNMGFTTKQNRHGFGLHQSACLAAEMDGSLKACSDGPGQGAMFTLVLPIRPAPTATLA